MINVVPLAYAALGAFTIVVQTILLREYFVVAAGNELSFAIAMAGWLLGVGAGSLAGAFFSARRPTTAAAFTWTALALCIVAPLLLAAVRNLHSLGAVPHGTLMPLARSFYLIPMISFPFCALSGFAFPLAAALRPLAEGKTAGAVADAYVWESLGAMAGGALYTFVLVGRAAPAAITLLLALPLLFAATIVSWRSARGRLAAALSLLAILVFLTAIAAGAGGRFDSWLAQQRWQGISSSRLAASRDTRFQNLQLGFADGQYSLFANGQLASVFPDDAGNELLAALLLSQHPCPRSILVIGDASGVLAEHLLRYPLSSLTAVEIDDRVAQMIVEHTNNGAARFLADPRLRRHSSDGRRFVRRAALAAGQRQSFDLVFIHQSDAWTAQLNRYYTREFFQDLKNIMNPDGVVALRLASAENYASEIVTPYTATIYKTLESVFPFIAIAPGMANFFFASNSGTSATQDPAILSRRYKAMAPAPARLAAVFASLYPVEKCAYIRAALRAASIPHLNSDDRPIGYFLGSRLLGWSTGSQLSGLFGWFANLDLSVILLALASVFLLLFLSWELFRRREDEIGAAPAVLAATCGGFAGLSFEITAIFIFKNKWGFVYRAVGILIALFMLGLGLGAAWTSRRIGKSEPAPHRAARFLAGVLFLISLTNLAFLLLRADLPSGLSGQLLLAAALSWTGLLVGAILPLGLRLLGRLPAGKGGGLLNAGDYLGGAVGSLLTAAFFLPLLGTGGNLLLTAFAALAAAAFLSRAAKIATKQK